MKTMSGMISGNSLVRLTSLCSFLISECTDKPAYEQYLEARRAKKWGRNPHIDPVDYIPIKYRTEKQMAERAARANGDFEEDD